MKFIGIDYGQSKIGLALGDSESGVATPYGVVKNLGWNNAIDQLKGICEKERIEKIVIGIPVNPEEMESDQIKKLEILFLCYQKKRV